MEDWEKDLRKHYAQLQLQMMGDVVSKGLSPFGGIAQQKKKQLQKEEEARIEELRKAILQARLQEEEAQAQLQEAQREGKPSLLEYGQLGLQAFQLGKKALPYGEGAIGIGKGVAGMLASTPLLPAVALAVLARKPLKKVGKKIKRAIKKLF